MGGNLNCYYEYIKKLLDANIIVGDILFTEVSLKDSATVERLFTFSKLNNVFDTVCISNVFTSNRWVYLNRF